MANRFLGCIVAIDVILPLKLAAILKACVSVSAPLQPIEQATFNRIGKVEWSRFDEFCAQVKVSR
jgi:hypothetical protein